MEWPPRVAGPSGTPLSDSFLKVCLAYAGTTIAGFARVYPEKQLNGEIEIARLSERFLCRDRKAFAGAAQQ